VPRHRVDIKFNDGTHRVVDFGPFLKQARNPMFRKYRRLAAFKSFHIHDGDLMWGDYEMIFPIMDSYGANILEGDPVESAHLVLSETAFPAASVSERKTKPVSYKKPKRKPRVRTLEN